MGFLHGGDHIGYIREFKLLVFQGADIGALKAFLNMVSVNLSATCSRATETSEVPKKSLLDLLDVINGILPSLL